MNKFRAWLEDKKNLPIVAAGAAIILILATLVLLKMTGVIGGGGPSTAQTGMQGYPTGTAGPQGMASMPATLEGTPPGTLPGAPAQPMGPMPATPQTAGVPGATPATGGEAAAQPEVEPAPKQSPMLPYRKDPFMAFAGPPKPSDVVAAMLPSVSRVRLAPAPVVEVPEEERVARTQVLPPQPFRRVAGVLWNGKVSAILETNGEVDIVRPGMEITRGNSRVRVESIEQNAVVLRTMDTETPLTIRVNMAGSVVGGPGTGPQQPGYPRPGGPAIYQEGPMPMEGPMPAGG
jgi:hypothetical protein